MARRAELLEFAVLGLLHESPMHGYELRKRLNTALGAFRALSYGSLYPALRDLLDPGWIAEARRRPAAPGAGGPHRLRADADGKERFQELVDGRAGRLGGRRVRRPPGLLRPHDPEVRLRILEGRRSRLEERLAGPRGLGPQPRAAGRVHPALQRHGEEQAEREVRWLEELITTERSAAPRTRGTAAATTTRHNTTARPPHKEHMGSIRVAIVGVGNCASSLVQGVEYYKDADARGAPCPDSCT